MRPLRKPLIACAAAIALAGVAGLAVAGARNAHVLDVRLPDGALAHIRYVGDTPPIVIIAPPPTISILSPIVDPFGAASPFAALDRLSQVMDRQADALFREAAGSELALTKPGLTQIDLGKLPDGAQGFAVVSTASEKTSAPVASNSDLQATQARRSGDQVFWRMHSR